MSVIRKIIFLQEGHFSQTYYEMFGIKTLEDNGFLVEVWSFLPFLKNTNFQEAAPPDPFTWYGYHVFNSKNEALKAVSTLTPDTIVICGLHYTIETYAFYRSLTKRKIVCCSNLAMALPTGTISNSRTRTINSSKFNFNSILNHIFKKIPPGMVGVKPVDIVFAMGEKFFKHGYPVNSKSEILWGHFYDYDKYLVTIATPSQTDLKTGIFLDEYLAFHPDNIDMGLPAIKADEYYPLLCSFFDFLETNYGVRITIAAHPCSKYDEMPDLFGGRSVIRGKTVELVKNAGFVIMHQSMSLNYAVLFKKPIIFVTTDQVNQHLIEDPSIGWLASFFGKAAHNLSNNVIIDFNNELKINVEAYKQYENDYIKKAGSAKIPLWEIFADRIKRIE